MKKLVGFLLLAVVFTLAAVGIFAFVQRRRLAEMSDEELRAFLAGKLGDKVPPEQLSAIQEAVVAKVRGEQGAPTVEVSGTVAYRERIAMPPDAVVIVKLLDTSRMDVAAEELGVHLIDGPGSVPVPYSIAFDPAEIDERHTYSVRATISLGDELLWTTDTNYPVITGGNPLTADLLLVAVPETVNE